MRLLDYFAKDSHCTCSLVHWCSPGSVVVTFMCERNACELHGRSVLLGCPIGIAFPFLSHFLRTEHVAGDIENS
jgi:hypothetical protein